MVQRVLNKKAEQIATAALEINAIKLATDTPFLWASGYYMPIYNDNRMFLFFPKYRDLIISSFIELIDSLELKPEVIAGTSTAGIPHATLLAEELELPMVYIRDKPKGHGLKNQIEGIDAESDLQRKNVLVIEDLISTGGSSARAVQAVRDANGIVTHCLSIFSYGLDKAVNAFSDLPEETIVKSLLDYNVLLNIAFEKEYLTKDQVELLKDWRTDPFGWGEKNEFSQEKK